MITFPLGECRHHLVAYGSSSISISTESAKETEEVEESLQDEQADHDESIPAQQLDTEPCMQIEGEPENEIRKDSPDEPTGMPSEPPSNGEKLQQDDPNLMLPIH